MTIQDMTIQVTITQVSIFGAIVLGLFGLVIFFFKHPDKIELWSSLYHRVFASKSLYHDKNHIRKNLNANINIFQKRLSKNFPGILAYGFRLEWISSSDPVSFVEAGDVIVRMHPTNDHDKNYCAAIQYYMKQSLLPNVRKHFPETLIRAIDLHMAHRILLEQTKTSAATYLLDDTILVELNKNEELDNYFKGIELIEDAGNFERVLLNEYQDSSSTLATRTPTLVTRQEIVEFYNFVHRISTRGYEHVPLGFNTNNLKVAVLLVAKTETFEQYGISGYCSRLDRWLSTGFQRVYVLARGDNNIELARKVVDKYCSSGFCVKLFEERFSCKMLDSSEPRESICIFIKLDAGKRDLFTKRNFNRLKEGEIVTATVVGTQPNGITVEITKQSNRLFIYRNELSYVLFNNPWELFKINDIIKVKVLRIGEHSVPVLSVKAVKKDPWLERVEIAPLNSLVTCSVKEVERAGIYVLIKDRLSGLIPITDVDEIFVADGDNLYPGDQIEATVKQYDETSKLVVLSLERLDTSTLENLVDIYPLGTIVKGKIIVLRPDYAIAQINGHASCFVHISEASWAPIPSMNDNFVIGEEIEAIVIGQDKKSKRLTCSIKQTKSNPLKATLFQRGDTVKAKVCRIYDDGILVELQGGAMSLMKREDITDTDFNVPLEELVDVGSEIISIVTYLNKEDGIIKLSVVELQKKKKLLRNIREFKLNQIVEVKLLSSNPRNLIMQISGGPQAFIDINALHALGKSRSDYKLNHKYNLRISRIGENNEQIELLPD